MLFTSYQLVANNTASLNTGSYLDRTEYSLFVRGYASDLWYGFSANDVIEFGVWDLNQNLLGWQTLNQEKNYNEVTLSYTNTLDFPVTYSYSELKTDFILYKNEKILVDPPDQISSSFGITSGSYLLTYNFTREMAGSPINPLVIKEISPSRTELKLVPLSSSNPAYTAFCNKKILLSDVSPLYLTAVKECPYSQIYAKVNPLYQPQINTIKSLFYLNTDGEMVTFLKNLYEDLIIFSSTATVSNSGAVGTFDKLIRIQGIKTYFTNYLLSNSSTIVDFATVDTNFDVFTSASIERKFAPIGAHPTQEYVAAKAFIFDFFTKYFYQPLSDVLTSTYNEKYYSHLRNALNLGNNRLLPIIDHDVMDERQIPSDPLTLLVKLKTELPNDIMAQTQCWVSNVSLSPYVVNAIIKSPISTMVHTIGPPDFSIPIPDASLTNTNLSYTAADLKQEDDTDRELVVSRNLTELNVDYTDFNNFVVFSSAEMRLKIFKNKSIQLAGLTASVQTLNQKNNAFLLASGSTYPFYTQELSSSQGQMNDVVNSFDGYESYLYRSGKYLYANGSFVSASYVTEQDNSASYYDKYNRDSLINNCPQHILTDPDNDDYVIFLTMVGQFFDEIYIYIANIPSQKTVGHDSTEEFTRRVVDYMLQTFGWTLDDSLEQANLLNNYLTSDQIGGLNSMSAEDRLKSVRNRMLINLPQIYKTKGTDESVRLLLACYGIPSTLLSMREYGGVNYTDETAVYTAYERAYMYQWVTASAHDYFQTGLPSRIKTCLFKTVIDSSEPYTYGSDQILFGSVLGGVSSTDISGSGEWAVGFVREPKKDSGRFFFRIGYKNRELMKLTSSIVPLFDGNIYSVMVRRNDPDPVFDLATDVDVVPTQYDLYVQRNNYGNEVLKVTASALVYDAATNQRFNGSSSNLMIGGWFADQNGQGFTGAMDKIQIWYDPLPDSNFVDYVNSINAYSFTGSRPPHESLLFRMHTDYPFDLRTDVWRNANMFYATASVQRQSTYLGMYAPANMDALSGSNTWAGAQALTYTSESCPFSQSVYPYQFRIVDYPSTIGISKYGPNKFRNEKVKHVSQSISARFDNQGRSTYIPRNNTSPDSTQVGFFVDPQDFKNKDIVRYFGNFDFMDAIGDPSNQYSESYSSLREFRKLYADSKTNLSGSRTLFNELAILYKLYFNRSIFDAIKNLVPARANALVGMVVEPTILERPKYESKPIFSEMNEGSVYYTDITASHYFRDPNTKLVRLTMSWEPIPEAPISLSYINFPNVIYPVNYGGNYIGDIGDQYQLGHFAGEPGVPPVFTPPVEVPSSALPSADFVANVFSGNVPLTVTFTNLSTNATNYLWDFGDGSTSGDANPIHTYSSVGTYTVTLTAYNGELSDVETKVAYITVTYVVDPTADPCGVEVKYKGGANFPTTTTINLGSGTGTSTLSFDAASIPDKFIVEYNGVEVINTGYRGQTSYQTQLDHALMARGLPRETIVSGGSGTATFSKSSSYPYAVVKVYGPLTGTAWKFTLGCVV